MVAQTSGGASYGSLRLWAAIGWGLAAVGMGAGVDRYGFSSVFIAYAIGTGLSSALVVACFENPKKPSRSDAAAAPASLASVFLVAPVPLYFLNFFIHGCLAAFVESYLLLFVATELVAIRKIGSTPSSRRSYAIPHRFLGLLILIAAVRDPRVSVREPRHRPDRRQTLSRLARNCSLRCAAPRMRRSRVTRNRRTATCGSCFWSVSML